MYSILCIALQTIFLHYYLTFSKPFTLPLASFSAYSDNHKIPHHASTNMMINDSKYIAVLFIFFSYYKHVFTSLFCEMRLNSRLSVYTYKFIYISMLIDTNYHLETG